MSRYDYWERSNGRKLVALMESDLFKAQLLPDIRRGTVFPAFRGRQAHFYYQGQKLFGFTNKGFQTNIAYLAAFDNRPRGEVAESALSSLRLSSSFVTGYKQIKRNIDLYRQPESGQVADLCSKHSCYHPSAGPIVVLDVELSLDSLDEGRGADRIDLILFNQESCQIRFLEVKTFNDKRIWPSSKGRASVAGQIRRYRHQVKRKNADLLAGYIQYVRLVNVMYGLQLPEPESIDPAVDLLVVDFDKNQQRQLEDELIPAFQGEFTCSIIGSATSARNGTLQKWWKNGRS